MKEEQLIKTIKSVLELHYNNFNDEKTRKEIVSSLTNAIQSYTSKDILVVKCDAENNPPSLIDAESICVSVTINDKLFVQVTASPHPFQMFSFAYDIIVQDR